MKNFNKGNLVKLVAKMIIIGIGLLALFYNYKSIKNESVNEILPAVERYTESAEVPQLAFESPGILIENTMVEVRLAYACQKKQTLLVYSKNELGEPNILEEKLLPAEQNEITFSMELPEENMLLFLGGLYSGKGDFSIEKVQILNNKKLIAEVFGAKFEPKCIGAGNGTIHMIGNLIATYDFNEMPEQSAQAYKVVSTSIDANHMIYQLIEQHDGIFYVFYDSVKDGFDSKINYEIGQCPTLRVALYADKDYDKIPQVVLTNKDDFAGLRRLGKYLMIFLLVLGLMDSALYFTTNRKVIANVLSVLSVAISGIIYAAEVNGNLVQEFCLFALAWATLACVNALSLGEREKRELSDEGKTFLASVLSIAMGFALFRAMICAKAGTPLYFFSPERKMNLIDYGLVTVLIIILFILLYAILKRNHRVQKRVILNKNSAVFVYLWVAELTLLATRNHYSFGSAKRYMACVLLAPLFVALLKATKDAKQFPFSKLLVAISYAITVVVWFISCGVCDIFIKSFATDYNVHHAGAYTIPIYYIAKGLPFTGGQNDLYGHYALFFKLPMMIFGSNGYVIGICMGVVGAITAAGFLYCMHVVLQHDFLRVIAAYVIALAGIPLSIYWQTKPHRYFFAAIMLAYAASCVKKTLSQKQIVIGYIIGMFGVLWSMEGGAVAVVSWAFYCIVRKLAGGQNTFGLAIKEFVLHMIGVCCSVVGSFLIVSVYNWIASGFDIHRALAFKEDTGVLLDAGYMVEFHQTPLEWTNDSWLYILATFLLLALYAISKCGLFWQKSELSSETLILSMVAIQGIGLFTFYMNRVAAGYGIVHVFIGMLIVGLIGQISSSTIQLSDRLTVVRNSVLGILVFCVCIYIANFEGSYEYLTELRTKAGSLNYATYKADLDSIQQVVPKDTWARGSGIPYIYMSLGWSMQEDANEPNTQYILLDYVTSEYTIVYDIPVGGTYYYLYINPNYESTH